MVNNEVGLGCRVLGSSILGGMGHWEAHGQIQLPCNVAGYGAVSCNVFLNMAGV